MTALTKISTGLSTRGWTGAVRSAAIIAALVLGCACGGGGADGGAAPDGQATSGEGGAGADRDGVGRGDERSDGSQGGAAADPRERGDDAAQGAAQGAGASREPRRVFVGSAGGHVRVFTMQGDSGALRPAGALDLDTGLDFLAVGPDEQTVFVSDDRGVSALRYDAAAKSLELVDRTETLGAGTHVAVDPSGQFVFVAHYAQGALSFMGYSVEDGFGEVEVLFPGKNAHQSRISASGRHVYVPCLGSDTVAQYQLSPEDGALTPAAPATVPAGDGPRHMVLHPSAPVAYVLDETVSAVQVFDIDERGALRLRAGDAAYLSTDERGHQSSDLQVTPDGRFVYAVNRQPPEVVTFRVEADHALTRLRAAALSGVVRSFAIDPDGTYLQIGGEDGRLAALRIEPTRGALSEDSAETGLGKIRAVVVR